MITAPPLLMPVPLIVNASAFEIVRPFRSNTAPDEIELAPPVVPSAEALPSFKVPAAIVVNPVWSLAPVSVNVPEPFFS